MNRITCQSVSKDFKIGFKKKQSILSKITSLLSGKVSKRALHALKDVSFEIKAGEIVGLIGKNGSGKSTLLRILAGVYKKYDGSVSTSGKIIPLILAIRKNENNRTTLEESIYVWGSLFGLSRKEIKQKFNSIVKFAELEEFVNTQLYQFSSGMLQRYIFSIAVHCEPDILLLDEIFAVGDESFKKKSVAKIQEMVKAGTSVILVSHDLEMIQAHSHKVIWLKSGCVRKIGATKSVLNAYKQDV